MISVLPNIYIGGILGFGLRKVSKRVIDSPFIVFLARYYTLVLHFPVFWRYLSDSILSRKMDEGDQGAEFKVKYKYRSTSGKSSTI